jgi:hypothetical protein
MRCALCGRSSLRLLVAADQASARHMALATGLTALLRTGSALTGKRRDSDICHSPVMLAEPHG